MKPQAHDYAIDLVKFLATFLVLNSHMGICYPKFGWLATGGAFGNALFFFVSGFTLSLSRPMRFIPYYKRRINRIYPVMIAMAILACLIWNSSENFIGQMTRYWFVNCIMIYYAVLWPVFNFGIKLIPVIVGSALLAVLSLLLTYDFNEGGLIYSDHVLRYFIYFGIMAQGAYMGRRKDTYIMRFWHPLLLFVSFIMWYVISGLFEKSPLQTLSIFCLFGVCYSLYVCCRMSVVHRLLKLKGGGSFILLCGSLCLEVYLIQKYIFTPLLNNLFPLNIAIIMACVILSAYALRILGRFIGQTFSSEPYDFKAMVKIQ